MNQLFRVKSIGSETLTLTGTVKSEDIQKWIRNTECIFTLKSHRATKDESGNWILTIQLVPDNGMIEIQNEPTPPHLE